MQRDRRHVAVVELQAHWLGLEFVREPAARVNHFGNAVHVSGVDSMEMYRMIRNRVVFEVNDDVVAFSATQRRSWHGAVVGPPANDDSGRYFKVHVARDETKLAHHRAGAPRAHGATIECSGESGGIESARISAHLRQRSA